MSSASLLWITPEPEKIIEYCARVSSPGNQEKMDTGELAPGRLLRYCAEHGHWSVFDMASACVSIHTTRDISAQIIRHRSFTFQEFSTRYAAVTDEIEAPELRRQGETNRQSSIYDETAAVAFQEDVADHIAAARDLYRRMIERGIARECARRILPLCTPTRMYMAGTIRSWIHYFEVRCKETTQPEHRDVALKCRKILARHLPVISEAFGWDAT